MIADAWDLISATIGLHFFGPPRCTFLPLACADVCPVSSCRPFVQEGSGSVHHLPDALGWSEEAFEVFARELLGKKPNLGDLLVVYRKYADDYRHLTDALTRTDDLIDQIVYTLYALAEEEIAIVEESVAP